MQSFSIKNNLEKILNQIPNNCNLVVVSKTQSVESIKTVYDARIKVFGENKVQELLEKKDLLPQDIQWHLIGHLQTNKVKYIADFVDTIQSVDSAKLLQEINKQAALHKRQIKVLLQVKIAEEDTKFGLEENQAKEIFNDWLSGQYPNIKIMGLMGMATFTDNESQVKSEFSKLKVLYDELSSIHPLKTLSMGMSGDYMTAIQCGANSVRIGSAIFGERNY